MRLSPFAARFVSMAVGLGFALAALLPTPAAAEQRGAPPSPPPPASPPPPSAPVSAPVLAKWGESNIANLRAMARPGDLAAPAAATPGSGQLEAAAIARLRDGKVIDLLREGSMGGGAGGGAPQ